MTVTKKVKPAKRNGKIANVEKVELLPEEENISKETSLVAANEKGGFVVEQQLARMTPAERKQIDGLRKQIDFKSTTNLMSFGNSLQMQRGQISDAVLAKYKTKDIGSVGDTLTGLATSLRSYTVETNDNWFTRLFEGGKNKIERIRIKYENVNTNVDNVKSKLEGEVITLTNDVNLLDKMYEKNIEAFKNHTMFIIAAKQKLDEIRNGELLDLRIKAESSGLPEDAEEHRELETKCDTFEKYIYDLELSRTLCLLSLPRIKSIQNANEVLVQKIKTTMTITIPIWKDAIANAIIAENTKQALDTQNAVDDATNEMLRNVATSNKNIAVGAAKASQRGIVDIETMKHMYDEIINTVKEIKDIEEEGQRARIENSKELANIELEYSQNLLITE